MRLIGVCAMFGCGWIGSLSIREVFVRVDDFEIEVLTDYILGWSVSMKMEQSKKMVIDESSSF